MLGFIRRWFSNSVAEAVPKRREPAVDDAVFEAIDSVVLDEPEDEGPGWWVAVPTDAAASARREAAVVDRKLYDRLAAALDNPSLELPQAPAVAQRALSALREPDVKLADVADIVSHDAALAADVLRLANSNAFRGFSEIRRLDVAFARLGKRELRRLLLTNSVKALASGFTGELRRAADEVSRQAQACAAVMAHLAGRARVSGDDAFLAGLLHDIGQLGVLRVLSDHVDRNGGQIPRALVRQLNDEWHEHLGIRLADAWGLPDPIPEIIGNHHRPVPADDKLADLRLLTQLADLVCSRLGIGPAQAGEFFEVPCVRRLGLADDAETREMLLALPEVVKQALAGVESEPRREQRGLETS